jgi:hypothetical protein
MILSNKIWRNFNVVLNKKYSLYKRIQRKFSIVSSKYDNIENNMKERAAFFCNEYLPNLTEPQINKKNIPRTPKKNHLLETIEEYLFSMLNIIAALASILGFFQINISSNGQNNNILKAIFLFLSIFFIVMIIILNYKNKTSLTKFIWGFHELNHLLRDEYFSSWKKYQNCSNKEQISDIASTFCHSIVNNTQRIVKDYIGKEVSVSIKIIDNNQQKDYAVDIENAEIYTLCRSDNTKQERARIDKQKKSTKIHDNIDFLMVVSEKFEDSYFAINNIKNFERNYIYFNTNNNWEEYYNATMVLPICLLKSTNDEQILSEIDSLEKKGLKNKKGVYTDILGFLCIDSKDKHAFKGLKGTHVLNFMAAIADGLYIHIEKCRYYYTKPTSSID